MTKTCNICDHLHATPRKRISKGVIVEQCVAKCHDDFVMGTGPSNQANFLGDAQRRFRAAGVTRDKG